MIVKFVISSGEEFNSFERAKRREIEIVQNKIMEVIDACIPTSDECEVVLAMLTDNPTLLGSLLNQYNDITEQTMNDVMQLDDYNDS